MIEPGETVTVPPLTGVAETKLMPSTAGIVTSAPAASELVKFLTRTRNGYESPGFTQPTADTKLFWIERLVAGTFIVSGAAPALAANQPPVSGLALVAWTASIAAEIRSRCSRPPSARPSRRKAGWR